MNMNNKKKKKQTVSNYCMEHRHQAIYFIVRLDVTYNRGDANEQIKIKIIYTQTKTKKNHEKKKLLI